MKDCFLLLTLALLETIIVFNAGNFCFEKLLRHKVMRMGLRCVFAVVSCLFVQHLRFQYQCHVINFLPFLEQTLSTAIISVDLDPFCKINPT